MNGVLNIDKPVGMTSHDVVARIRRITGVKRVGHAGTLDPDATGVLLVCIGKATRIAEYLACEGKTYVAELTFGLSTDTQDSSGRPVSRSDASHITEQDLLAQLSTFTGDVMQIPPMVSAVHYAGRRLYELARQGVVVDRAARAIEIDRIDVLGYQPGIYAKASIEVNCGKGTYVRTLCHDIGEALGVGGHMSSLRRTRIGQFSVEAAVRLETLNQAVVIEKLIPASRAMDSYAVHVCADSASEDHVRHGRALASDLADAPVARISNTQGELLGLGRVAAGLIHPFKVFFD